MEQVTSPEEEEWHPTGIRPNTHLFNIYISDLPTTVSRNYAYANDLAIMYADGDWQTVEGVGSKGKHKCIPPDLDIKFCTTKAVLAAELWPENLQ